MSFSLQWTKDGADIPGATDSSYSPVTADVGHQIGFKVTATNTIGSTVALSASVTVESATPYPPAIEAAGLETVWDLSVATGSSGALTPVASYSLPAGVTHSGTAVTSTASAAVSAIDFTGNGVFAINDGNVLTATNAKFAFNGGARVLDLGHNSGLVPHGSPSAIIDHATFDLTGVLPATAAAINAAQAAGLTATNCSFNNSSRTILTWGSTGTMNLTGCWVGKFGQNTSPTDHLQAFHIFNGTHTYTHCKFDPTGMTIEAGITAILYFEAFNGPINATLDGCVIVGAKNINIFYPIQAGAHHFDCTLTIRNCVIEAGIHGKYLSHFQSTGFTMTVIDGGGNIDFDTAQPIVLT